jgi:hypothetical protein
MIKLFFLLLWSFTQPAHVSLMSAECFPDEGVIRVFLKMSQDDFKYDYRFMINDDQIFDTSGKIDTTEVLVSKYLNSRIRIFAGEQLLKGRLTKLESANGEVNVNLLYSYNGKAKQFKVDNTFLNGVNRNPSNLLIFKYNDFEEEVKLTQEKTYKSFRVK